MGTVSFLGYLDSNCQRNILFEYAPVWHVDNSYGNLTSCFFGRNRVFWEWFRITNEICYLRRYYWKWQHPINGMGFVWFSFHFRAHTRIHTFRQLTGSICTPFEIRVYKFPLSNSYFKSRCQRMAGISEKGPPATTHGEMAPFENMNFLYRNKEHRINVTVKWNLQNESHWSNTYATLTSATRDIAG